MLIVDAHLDLAMNALEWNRDLSRPIDEIRAREQELTDKPDRGRGTVSFPEMRRGGVGLCVATQIARYVALGQPLPGWHSPEQAWAMTQGQLAWYRAMEERGELVPIPDRAALDAPPRALGRQPAATDAPIGYVLSLEGADSIVTLGAPRARLRAGAAGRRSGALRPGRLRQRDERDRRSRRARARAAAGDGAAGHHPRRHAPLRRQLPRRARSLPRSGVGQPLQLPRARAARPAVHATIRFASSIAARRGHRRGVRRLDARARLGARHSTPERAGVTLETVADHIDHICQLAGNARHCGIGSDLDGAFGREQCPSDVETIADLARLSGILARARLFALATSRRSCHGQLHPVPEGGVALIAAPSSRR